MTTRFSECLPLILAHEGGWADHPKDPGGATMKGVTLGTYSEWLGRPATKTELRNISDDHLRKIYEANYWRAAACDRLPPGVDYMVFDFAVNSGPGRARKFLQRVAGVAPDGAIGPVTVAAVNKLGARLLIDRLNEDREAFYRSLDTFPTFGKGWLRRLTEVTAEARAMVK